MHMKHILGHPKEHTHTYQSCAVALLLQYFGKSGFIWRKPSWATIPKNNTVIVYSIHS